MVLNSNLYDEDSVGQSLECSLAWNFHSIQEADLTAGVPLGGSACHTFSNQNNDYFEDNFISQLFPLPPTSLAYDLVTRCGAVAKDFADTESIPPSALSWDWQKVRSEDDLLGNRSELARYAFKANSFILSQDGTVQSVDTADIFSLHDGGPIRSSPAKTRRAKRRSLYKSPKKASARKVKKPVVVTTGETPTSNTAPSPDSLNDPAVSIGTVAPSPSEVAMQATLPVEDIPATQLLAQSPHDINNALYGNDQLLNHYAPSNDPPVDYTPSQQLLIYYQPTNSPQSYPPHQQYANSWPVHGSSDVRPSIQYGPPLVPRLWPTIPFPPAQQTPTPPSPQHDPTQEILASRFCRVQGCLKYSGTRKDCSRHRDTHFVGRYRCPNPACGHRGKQGTIGTFPRPDTLIRHWATKCKQFAVSTDQVEDVCCVTQTPYWSDYSLDPFDPTIHVPPQKTQ